MAHLPSPDRLYPKRLDDFFETAASRHPKEVALERPAVSVHDVDVSLTYAELERAAEQLAARLRLFVGPNDIVMLAFPRTDVDAYVSLLAVLKSGAAYCALDLTFPDDRIRQLIVDARPKLLLTADPSKARFIELVDRGQRVLSPEDLRASRSVARKSTNTQSTDLAYVIYTSGTTGTPKGVMIEHGQISNLIASDLIEFDLSPSDRLLQGSSLSYDSSVEEIFMAWSCGATLVIGSDETVRLGPDLASWLRERKITAFAPPPTLLRTMGGREVASSLNELRFLYVGGEALTTDVVDAWGPGRTLINGYGPTECSVTVVRGEVKLTDDEVSIGRPIHNHQAYVLDDTLKPVPEGDLGELCIAGPGLARGYLGQPEITAQKFPHIEGLGRVYRTGDLVSRRSDGEFLYHGRIDTQVKLRGYRLELTSIESHLCQILGVKSAACKVQSSQSKQSLIAFVTHERPKQFSERALKQRLGEILPSYMVPARIALVEALPQLTSGKIDRKRLPDLELKWVPGVDERVAAANEVEAVLAGKMAEALGLDAPVCVKSDFFEFGGDSLAAALLISELRCMRGFEGLTVRDVYLHRNVRTLARVVEELRRSPEVLETVVPPKNKINPLWCNLAQAMSILFGSIISLGVIYTMSFGVLPILVDAISIWGVLLILWFIRPILSWGWLPVSLGLVLATKWSLVGRYKVGSFPVWGQFYFRHWLVKSVAKTLPWSVIEGTVMHNWVLRLLGAKIGKNVYLHRGVKVANGGWDLLHIGDDVTVGRDVSLRPLEFAQLEGHLGPVTIGAKAILETRSGISHHGVVGEGCEVGSHACVRAHESVPRNRRWVGAIGESCDPIHKSGPDVELVGFSEWGYALRLLAMRWLVGLASALPALTLVVAAMLIFSPQDSQVMDWLFSGAWQTDDVLLIIGIAVCAAIPFHMAYLAILTRLIGTVPLGAHPIRSMPFLKAWLKESVMQSASAWLSGTLFWPRWLRLSGMKVGQDCEISTIMEFVPEHVELKGSCFSADGIYFAVPKLGRGTVHYESTCFEKSVFLGNHAVIDAGTHMPEGVLLGVCTVAPKDMYPGSSWFGNPTFELPNREVVVMPKELTHKPSLIRYIHRLFWESLRFALPSLGLLSVMIWFRFASPDGAISAWEHIIDGALVGVAIALGSVSSVIFLKWGLLGRVGAGQHALWSSWCSRWDFVYVYWGVFARRILSVLEGTQMLNAVLRLFGVGIGKRVFLGGGFGQVVDPDMLNFEDGATVVNLFQAHSFEDRVLKIAPVRIEKDSSVGEGTVMLYGARIGAASLVGEQSVVMKNESLSPFTRFAGAPTRPMNRVFLSPRDEVNDKAVASDNRAV